MTLTGHTASVLVLVLQALQNLQTVARQELLHLWYYNVQNLISSITYALHFTLSRDCCASTISVILTLQLGSYNSLHSYGLSAYYSAFGAQNIFTALSGFVPMENLQNVDLAIAAAEDMEAKLSLVAKQVQPSVNAPQHNTTSNKPKKGRRSQGCGQGQDSPVRWCDSVNALQPALGSGS